ncbi:hypothetical protein ASC63_08570 [Leifsonia sp. Root112D2]|nr:hypothetical protein ASC63_08570 [Leifsonia sp. Root112D2]
MDTRESESERKVGEFVLSEAKQRAAPLLEKWESYPRPQAGSRLSEVDQLTPYKPSSYQLRDFMNVSLDSIRMLIKYVDTTNEIPMLAHYALIRSAVEATSYGIWMLNAGTKQKQAWLSLRLSYENNEDIEGMEKVFATAQMTPPNRNDVRVRLVALQQQLSDYRNHDISKTPTTTDVVAQADRFMSGKRMVITGLQTWKACSGTAHANGDVISALLERVPTGHADALGLTFRLTSRVTLTAGFLLVAVENAEELLRLFEEASKPTATRMKVKR